MRIFQKKYFAVLGAALPTFVGCGPGAPKGPVVLGSYFAQVDTSGAVTITPITDETAKTSSSPALSDSHAYVGWNESIAQGGPVPGAFPVRPINCSGTNATYNAPARTLSVQFQLRNVLSNSTPECSDSDTTIKNTYCPSLNGLSGYVGKRILGPVELKVYDYYGTTTSNCTGSGYIAGVLNSSTSACVGPLARTDLINLNHDFGCSNVSSSICFNNDVGFTYSADAHEYKTLIPSWDVGTLLNTSDSDFDLDPLEVSGCKVMQFFYSSAGGTLDSTLPNNVPAFGFAFDVLGFIETYGAITNTPTVTVPASATSYASSSNATVSATIASPADRVRVTNGSTETECVDNAGCDSNATTNAITMSVALNTNQSNRLYIHQANATNMGPAVMRTVVHDSTAPTVTTVSPANGAVNVSPSVGVTVNFSEAMDSATITTTTFTVKNGASATLCTSVSLSSDGLTATCSHTSDFPTSTLLSVAVTTGAKDLAGNAVTAFSSSFTSGASDSIRPTIVSVSPADNAADIPINVAASVTFSEAMKSSTITTTNLKIYTGTANPCPPTALTAVTATVSLSSDQTVASISPSSSLAANTEYTLSVSNNVQDAAGNTMQQSNCTTFRTSSSSDSTRPQIVGSTPNSGATNVVETVRPEIFFSEAMDSSTLTATNIQLKRKDTQASVSLYTQVNSDSLTVRIIPTTTLVNGQIYTMTVLSDVKDLAGNTLGAPWAIEFTVAASSDSTAPQVILIQPQSNSADNSVAPIIKLRFSEPMNASTIHTGTFTVTSAGDGPGCSSGAVSGSVGVSGDGLEASFLYSGTLCARNTFTVGLTGGSSGAKDLAGNALASSFSSSFRTAKRSGSGPVVVTASPGGGTTGVGTDAKITIVFDQVIDTSSVSSSTVYVSAGSCPSGGTALSAAYTFSADGTTVTVDPAAALTASTTYRINVTTGVTNKNTPSDSATATCTTFTTGSAADSTRPSVSSTTPTNGSSTLKRWESLTVTFDEAIDPKTVGPANVELIRSSDSFRIPTKFSFDTSGKVLTINPSNLLGSNITYYVNLKQSIRDTAGYALSSFYTFSFTTVTTSDSTAPTVSSVSLYKGTSYSATCGGTGVARSTNISGKEIKVYFSEPIDPDTAIYGVFSLLDTPGASQTYVQLFSVTLSTSDASSTERSMIKIRTDAQLSNGTNYQIKILTDVTDDADNALVLYTCNFST
jgi:hypothetical protein